MARDKGQSKFSSNFEVKISEMLDPRLLVDTKEELINKETWPYDGNTIYMKEGMFVYVKGDGFYELVSLANILAEDYSGWKKVTSGAEGGFVNITWAELKALRDSKTLTVGTYYRITDYVTTTMQENTRSAGYPFDIIVLATDVDTLSEEAMAAVHEGDTYFTEAGANLSAWKIWYSLDNDTSKHGWAGKNILLGEIKPASGVSASGIYTYDKPIARVEFSNILYKLSIGIETMIMSGPPVYVKLIDSYTLLVSEAATGYVATTSGIKVYSEEIIGKGVIYRMIDEYNNDLPYDFKNIIYMAKPSFSVYTHYGSSYFATFTITPDTQTIEGITYYKYTMTYKASGPFIPSDELWTDVAIPTTEMGVYTIVDGIVNNESYTIFNVVSDKYDAYTFSTKLGNDTYDASLSGSVYNNTMKGFYNNGILQLNKNLFIFTGDRANFHSNIFGDNCHSNNFGNDCYSNNFGNNCHSNNLDYGCYSNNFGNDCYLNSFGNYCYQNNFGNSCSSNNFGNHCQYNSFGNNCNNINFGKSSTIKSYYRYIIVDNGNSHIDLYCPATTSSSNYYQNVRIALGVNNTTPNKTISDGNFGQTYQTLYKPTNSKENNI